MGSLVSWGLSDFSTVFLPARFRRLEFEPEYKYFFLILLTLLDLKRWKGDLSAIQRAAIYEQRLSLLNGGMLQTMKG